jgi:hypothetical protein
MVYLPRKNTNIHNGFGFEPSQYCGSYAIRFTKKLAPLAGIINGN